MKVYLAVDSMTGFRPEYFSIQKEGDQNPEMTSQELTLIQYKLHYKTLTFGNHIV